MKGRIYTGTASWTDPGFVADWYPKKLPASQRLAWYADHFPLVELNSSFYAVPDPRSIQRWCEQTPKGFIFDVKLHKLLSRHSTPPELLPPELRPKGAAPRKKVELTPELEAAMTQRFLSHLEPFKKAGKLGALLLQLSPGFSPRSNELAELDRLMELLSGYTVAIELRNRSWLSDDHAKSTAEWFRRHRASFVMVDAPEEEHFTILPNIDLITNDKLAYLRAHGRNARGYISGRTVAERFNYDYSDAELEEIAKRSAKLAGKARELHVIYNNNASDYAPRAGLRFQNILANEYPGLRAPATPIPTSTQATFL
jgi:uncharacterized protein YecE (DUF72 family)